MLSNLSELFDQIAQGNETIATVLIDTLGADLSTEVERSGHQRKLLDAVLRAPTRSLFDRAHQAYMERGHGRHPGHADQDWSRWLRNDTFRKEVFSHHRDTRHEHHGALVAAFQGMRPWAIQEILDREKALMANADLSSSESMDRSCGALLQMVAEHALGHRRHDDPEGDANTLAVLKLLQERYHWSPEEWMTPVIYSYHKMPAALSFAASVSDESVLRWLVNDVGLSIHATSEQGEGWVNALQDQTSLKGIAWLIDQGYDWDTPFTSTHAYNIEFSQPTLHAWLDAKASWNPGERPEIWDQATRWDQDVAFQQRIQALLLRQEAQQITGDLAPRERARL